jgi:hypothetical protein
MLEDIAHWDQEREDMIRKKRETKRLKKEAEERERMIEQDLERESRRQAKIAKGEDPDDHDKSSARGEEKPAEG